MIESPNETALVDRLRAGDEAAFDALVAAHDGTMLAIARSYVRTRSVAEEVVQDAWLAVLHGIGRFERRSSLRTWIAAIVVNTARTRGVREAQMLTFASVAPSDAYPGSWWGAPSRWADRPDEALESQETLRTVQKAIERLPDAQRMVITMRDVVGCSAAEVCAVLDLSEGNQRVLLHRARFHVRLALSDRDG